MTPDPHPPVLSDDDDSDDDFESASEGEQEQELERDSLLNTPAAKVLAPVQEPVQHAAVKQPPAPLQPTLQSPSPSPPPQQQQTQQQQQLENQVPRQQQTQQQELQSSINAHSHHHNVHSDASSRLSTMSLKDRTAAGPAMPSHHVSIDTPPTHTPARAQECVLSQKRMDDPQRSTSPPTSSPGYPRQFSTPGSPSQPPSLSLSTKPPLAPSFSGTQQQQPPRSQQQYQQQQQQQKFGSNQSHYQQQSGPRPTDPSVATRNKQQQEAGRGWGSLGSWINTAVSTVSEVIENPNVVVSKAHTIGE